MPAALAHPPLQLFVDLTPEHGVLRPPAGTYGGPVVISRPMTVDGQGEVTIDGGGEGTVLTVRAGVLNLADEMPPFSNQAYYFLASYDPTHTDPRGRTYFLSLNYAFR